ncbi:rhomboid family intramembrane serine protease [Gilvibacter sediminis]|uniref:rhomboid family intramembrane serine protease n=1 Tax=Gilvibacter sediminis TaxID=379071 RepID=UPI002350A50E|nr:rhomboid family intramembrane serine protease [Gilvibacter sediminis]MDC7998915.1 rhomboid family intramembrane serine protease [Gilvibacter sediminis]
MYSISETVKVLLIINVIVFVGTMSMPDTMYQLFSLYFYENPSFKFWQPVTHMFMHGSVSHIAFNMLGLWMFGTPLERQWGSKRFLFFYFSAGLGAALIHTLANYIDLQLDINFLTQVGIGRDLIDEAIANGQVFVDYPNINFEGYFVPAVGASGAVYGVMTAFAVYYPNAQLMMIFLPIPIKAKYFVPLILIGYTVLNLTDNLPGIAHWAHVGGALFGFIMAWSWRKTMFNPQ